MNAAKLIPLSAPHSARRSAEKMLAGVTAARLHARACAGEMQNLEQKEREGSEDEDDKDKEEPEHDMGGELDEDQQEVVDEKLWDKEEACAQTREGRERAEDEGGESEREEESER